ncbi:hypothetical protein K438DRAFT_1831592, partial [Mycena galopus ATCC 62051]
RGNLGMYRLSLSITRLFYLIKLPLTMDNSPKPPISVTQKSEFFSDELLGTWEGYMQLDTSIYI